MSHDGCNRNGLVENVGVRSISWALPCVRPCIVNRGRVNLDIGSAPASDCPHLARRATAIPQPFDIALTPPQVLALRRFSFLDVILASLVCCHFAGSLNGLRRRRGSQPIMTVTNNGRHPARNHIELHLCRINGTIPTSVS